MFCAPKGASCDSCERAFGGEAESFESGFSPPVWECAVSVSACGLLGVTVVAVAVVTIVVVVNIRRGSHSNNSSSYSSSGISVSGNVVLNQQCSNSSNSS